MKTNHGLLKRYSKIANRWNSQEYDGLRRDDKIADILAYSNLKSLPIGPRILDAMSGTGKVGQAINERFKEEKKNAGAVFSRFYSGNA